MSTNITTETIITGELERVTELTRNISKMKNELVFSRYSLNPLAQDIVQLMISQIKHEFVKNPEFNIKIRYIEDKIDRKLKEDEIILACQNILNQKIYLNTKNLFAGLNWCEYVYYEKDTRSLKIKFTEKVASLLLDLVNQGGFTKMNLKYFLKIKSFYAKRIYMLIKGRLDFETEKSGKKESTKILSIEDIKDTLDISQDSYKEMSDLKKRVIDIALTQINKFTDINLKVEYLTSKGKGKKYTKIKFISSFKEELKEEKKEEIKTELKEIKNFKLNKQNKQKEIESGKEKIDPEDWAKL